MKPILGLTGRSMAGLAIGVASLLCFGKAAEHLSDNQAYMNSRDVCDSFEFDLIRAGNSGGFTGNAVAEMLSDQRQKCNDAIQRSHTGFWTWMWIASPMAGLAIALQRAGLVTGPRVEPVA